MVVQEWTTLFHVAFITGLVDAVLHQQLGASRAMRIMTIGADYLAFLDRVVRGPTYLSTLLFVTGVANVCLGAPVAHLVLGSMHVVA